MEKKDTRTITLPSGKTAEIRKLIYKDRKLAARVANPMNDPFGFIGAMIAAATKIDGKELVAEDIDDMDLKDADFLQDELGLTDVGNSQAGVMSFGSQSSQGGARQK